MALLGRPITWYPRGLSDAVDGSSAFNGAMAQLANLIPDPSTDRVFVPRPACIPILDNTKINAVWGAFNWGQADWGAAATNMGPITAALQIGGVIYGMIGNQAGNDEPFAFNLVTNALVPVSGITAANTPTSPATGGDWTPPQMALVGTKIAVTHPGFNFGGGFAAGWIDISNLAAPAWTAGNVATNPLPAKPTGVTQMGNRAYYVVGNAINASDVNDAKTVTNANQVLLVGDSRSVTAIGSLPLYNTAGGIVQAVICFKGVDIMYQVTGDPALGTWAQNSMNVATGTLAPNSVTPTPMGLAFMSPEGLRFVSFVGSITEPVGDHGSGVSMPFINAINPSRMFACYAADTIRISVINGNLSAQPWQEYWYDLTRKVWSGPHSCAGQIMVPYKGTFVIVPQAKNPGLYQSDVKISLTSAYLEFGTQLAWTFSPVLLPDTGAMAMNSMVETQLAMALPGTAYAGVVAQDEQGVVLDQLVVTSTSPALPTWGNFNWGAVNWGSASKIMAWQLPWHQPIVFNQLGLIVNGPSIGGVRLAALRMRYEPLGFIGITAQGG